MYRTLSLAWLFVSGALLALAPAAEPPSANGEIIIVRRCLLEYKQATNLGAPIPGILQDCLVDIGDKVKAGQVLGRLQDAEEQAKIKVAETKYQLAVIHVQASEPLVRSKAIAQEQYQIYKGEQEVAAAEIVAAKAAVHVREIVSPFDGVVVGVFKSKGESMHPAGNVRMGTEAAGPEGTLKVTEAIFRVVNPDVVRVTGYLDVTDAWRVQPGQAVRMTPEFAGADMQIKQEVCTGKVVFVDSEIDPRTRTCKVVAEVSNREGLLRSGLEARMEILPERKTP